MGVGAYSSRQVCMLCRGRSKVQSWYLQTVRRTIRSLNFANGAGWIEAFRAVVDAVHDRAAAEESIGILKVVEPFAGPSSRLSTMNR